MGSSKALFLLMCALAGAAFAAQEQRCREGWSMFEGSCYRVFQNSRADDWSDAEEQCHYNDGYLAELTSEDENTFVKDLVKKVIPDGDGKSAWIGALYDSAFGGWKWELSRDKLDYTDWADSSVARRGWGSRVFKCGSLSGSDGWSWKDGSCDEDKDYYVCERCLLQEKCSGGSCYTLQCRVDEERDAKWQCKEEGGYLAEITTEEEHTVVKDFLRTATIPASDHSWDVKGVLVGGNDREKEGTWVWSNSGDAIDLGFSGWGTDQPDNKGWGGRPQNCLVLNQLEDFSFDDAMCFDELPCLCERPETQDTGVVG